MAEVIPRICGRVFRGPDNLPVTVDFIVAGNGPKRILLEEAIETFGLQSRVQMLGELRLSQMRDSLLVQGDIFLNTSLTEAFCMAIVEAASCGLLVVSTKVGGIPEVLPEELIHFVEPDASSIEDGLITAVKRIIEGQHVSKRDAHEFIKKNYTWRDVSRRTEIVYNQTKCLQPKPLARRVRNLWECGRLAGPIFATLYLFCHYWIIVLDSLFWSGN